MNKKGQEEIIGFVLVIVIVAVIFLVFLGIFIRQESAPIKRESIDVSHFLRSSMEFTSNCSISSEKDYLSLGELVKECYSLSRCRSGEDACEVFKKEIREIIESNWQTGEDRPVKGYIFNASYNSESLQRDIIFLSAGICSGTIIGAEYLSPAYPGNIRSVLEICY